MNLKMKVASVGAGMLALASNAMAATASTLVETPDNVGYLINEILLAGVVFASAIVGVFVIRYLAESYTAVRRKMR